MKIIDEFKAFAVKGNVADMAVGIILGVAFGKIVTSLVNDIIMPPIGILVGGIKFSELSLVLKEAVGETPAVTLNYGNFLQVTFDFLLVAFAVFMIVKAINSAKRKEDAAPAAPAAPPKQEVLLEEIRDLLKK
ncbi:large-conductance mechanosensitive channel protein MscL [Fulvivirga sp.]|uniref:large-conductance mechanosensitive channel protein MscL n=1 Tax=Fulvivirga sp. TaxID=1931237 RepID=UPI0032EC23F2